MTDNGVQDSVNGVKVKSEDTIGMANTTTDEVRHPLSLQINGYGTVTSRRPYSREEVEDIVQFVVEVVDTVAISPNDVRLIPRGIEVTET